MSGPEVKPDIIHHFNDEIMKFPYREDISMDPTVHIGLNPLYLQMRQEIHNLTPLQMRGRRKKLRELYVQDFLREVEELREVDLAFINTQPQ